MSSNGGGLPPAAAEAKQSGGSALRLALSPSAMQAAEEGKQQQHAYMNRARSNVRQKIKELDVNQDGTIDEAEMVQAVEQLVHEEQMRKVFMCISVGLVVAIVIMIGTLTGMTYGIIQASKDTRIDGVVLVDKSSSEPVRVASVDLSVKNNTLVQRDENGTVTSGVIRTASLEQRIKFSSRVPIQQLMELKHIDIVSSSGAELMLSVWSVARIPKAASRLGSVVKIHTPDGTITLDDTDIYFNADVAPIFAEAGFIVDGAGRKLLGAYEIFGFFNFIQDLTVFGLESNATRPRLPTGDLRMTLKVYEPCMVGDENRCVAIADNSTGTPAISYIPGYELKDGEGWVAHTEYVSKKGDMVQVMYHYAAWADFVKLEVANLATKTVNAWMTAFKNLNGTAVVSNTTGAPSGSTTGTLGAGNQNGNTTTDPITYWCQQFPMPTTQYSNLVADLTKTRLEYVGGEKLDGRDVRRFRLTTTQEGLNKTTFLLTVDYWDSDDAKNLPVRYIANGENVLLTSGQKVSVKAMVDFVLVESVTLDAALFVVPSNDTCVLQPSPYTGIKWMKDAYTLPGKVYDLGPYPADAGWQPTSTGKRRMLHEDNRVKTLHDRLIEAHYGRETVDFLNRYPTREAYDAAHPNGAEFTSNSTEQFGARRRSLIGSCDTLGVGMPQPNFGPCSFGLTQQLYGGGQLSFSCGINGDVVPFIKIGGSLSYEWCPPDKTWKVSGCLTAGLTAAFDGSSAALLGDALSVAISVCMGYDSSIGAPFMQTMLSINLGVIKADVEMTFMFKPFCVQTQASPVRYRGCSWLESAGISGYIGFGFLGLNIWFKLGTFSFIPNRMWITGSAGDMPNLPAWSSGAPDSCQASFSRPLVSGVDTCPDGMYQAGALCYPNCPSNYPQTTSNVDLYCYSVCPGGYDVAYYAGYASTCYRWWLPSSIGRPVTTRGAYPLICRKGTSQVGALCYGNCPSGWYAKDITCFKNSCPGDKPLTCGFRDVVGIRCNKGDCIAVGLGVC